MTQDGKAYMSTCPRCGAHPEIMVADATGERRKEIAEIVKQIIIDGLTIELVDDETARRKWSTCHCQRDELPLFAAKE